jgi:hypothetical protein
MITSSEQLSNLCMFFQKLQRYYLFENPSLTGVKSLRELASRIIQKDDYTRIQSLKENFFQAFRADHMRSIFKNSIELQSVLNFLSANEISMLCQVLSFDRIAAILNIDFQNTENIDVFANMQIAPHCRSLIFKSLSVEQMMIFIQTVQPHWCDLILIRKDAIPTFNEISAISRAYKSILFNI